MAWEGAADAAALWVNLDSATITLTLRTIGDHGVDQVERTHNDATDALDVAIKGQRRLIVSVRIASARQVPGANAQHYASLLRTRLQRDSVLEALDAAGLGLTEVMPTIEGDITRNDRRVSIAITDVLFSCAEYDTDAGASGSHVKNVEVTGNEGAPHQVSFTTDA